MLQEKSARTCFAVKIHFIITVMRRQLTLLQLTTDVTTPLHERTQVMPLDTDLQLSHATRSGCAEQYAGGPLVVFGPHYHCYA